MKYCRFVFEGKTCYGKVEDRAGELWIVDLAQSPEEDLGFRIEHPTDPSWSSDFEPMPLKSAALLAPVTPSKIICVGRNYRDHVKELGNEMPEQPLIFFKPPSSLLRPGGVIVLPAVSERVDFEGELAMVIGKRCRNLTVEDDWREIVRGWTLANDISARDLQKKDVQWTRAKGFDTFGPVGPIVSDEIDPVAGVTIETRLNGEVKQHASTLDFIFGIPTLLAFISAAFTLEPGDLILTGTPSGVAPLKPGDSVEVEIEGLGVLKNTVVSD